MNWVDVLAIIILTLTFLGGLKEGAIKNISSLVALLIAIPCAGLSYHFIAAILSFLPGTNWENFLGFFIAMAIISVILHFIFLLPRKTIQKIWEKGLLFRLVGGIVNVLNASIGMVVFTLVLRTYPIIAWLANYVSGSTVLTSLMDTLGFVQAMLPEVFHKLVPVVIIITGS